MTENEGTDFERFQRDQIGSPLREGLIEPSGEGDEVPVDMGSPVKSTYELNVENAKSLKLMTTMLKILILTFLALTGLGILSLIFKINLTPSNQNSSYFCLIWHSKDNHRENHKNLQDRIGSD